MNFGIECPKKQALIQRIKTEREKAIENRERRNDRLSECESEARLDRQIQSALKEVFDQGRNARREERSACFSRLSFGVGAGT